LVGREMQGEEEMQTVRRMRGRTEEDKDGLSDEVEGKLSTA